MSTTQNLLKKVVLTQAQFTARQTAGTLQEGVEYEISDARDDVVDVQVNGTSVVNATTGVANIPIAGNSTLGTITCSPGSDGINLNSANGKISIAAASAGNIQNKTESFRPLVPSTLDIAIREGLGNNALTWTDAYKSSARNTIGAITMMEYDSTASTYAEGVLYYVVD